MLLYNRDPIGPWLLNKLELDVNLKAHIFSGIGSGPVLDKPDLLAITILAFADKVAKNYILQMKQ